jgi:hypothetical protein
LKFSPQRPEEVTSTMSEDRVVKGSSFPASLVSAKCAYDYKSVAKKKVIDLEATGSPKTNLMLALLRCETEATKTCQGFEKEYTKCHKSFMGVGSYKGKRHCGDEMSRLHDCIASSSGSSS